MKKKQKMNIWNIGKEIGMIILNERVVVEKLKSVRSSRRKEKEVRGREFIREVIGQGVYYLLIMNIILWNIRRIGGSGKSRVIKRLIKGKKR